MSNADEFELGYEAGEKATHLKVHSGPHGCQGRGFPTALTLSAARQRTSFEKKIESYRIVSLVNLEKMAVDRFDDVIPLFFQM